MIDKMKNLSLRHKSGEVYYGGVKSHEDCKKKKKEEEVSARIRLSEGLHFLNSGIQIKGDYFTSERCRLIILNTMRI